MDYGSGAKSQWSRVMIRGHQSEFKGQWSKVTSQRSGSLVSQGSVVKGH